MAGTSAAHSLTRRGFEVTILEKNDRLGGRIHSHLVEGAAVEMGAGFMTRIYSNVHDFLRREGLEEQLYRQYGNSGMMRDGQLRMANLQTLAGNKALSWPAKLQILPLAAKTLMRWRHLDHHAFWKAAPYDERSVVAMFPKQKQEIVEYLLQPMLNGYFYWAPEHVSEAMLFSLAKAALMQGGTYKMQGGLQQIPERAAKGSAVLLGCEVTRVFRNQAGRYEVVMRHEGKEKRLQADGIICATTASGVPVILKDLLTSQQRAFFEAVRYSSTAVLARTYQQDQTRGDKGIAFPRLEGSDLAAVTVSPEPGKSNRLANVKAFASGAVGKQLCAESDAAIASRLTKAMESIRQEVLAGDPQPLSTHLQRWPEALPFFDVGHFKRLRAFEEGGVEDGSQLLTFAGDYLGGPFMEGAFTSGMKAADRLAQRLGSA